MAVLLKSDNLKALLLGLAVSFGITLGYFLLYHDSGLKKAVFGFFYFLITPFLALSSFPIGMLIMIIFFLLFRRVQSCMRENLRWVAYALLWLHWVAFGLYCASYVVV
jgi:hypothetical protein